MSGRILGLDVGDVRIGIAVSDETRLIATPHSVYTRVGWGPDTKHIQRLYAETKATLIVCGLPRNMFQDERLSTVSAHQALIEGGVRRDGRKGTVDKVAAAVILQSYLDGQGKEAPAGNGMNE